MKQATLMNCDTLAHGEFQTDEEAYTCAHMRRSNFISTLTVNDVTFSFKTQRYLSWGTIEIEHLQAEQAKAWHLVERIATTTRILNL